MQTISYKVTAACDINASLWASQSNVPKVSMGWTIAETTVDGTEGKDTIVWDATGATTFKLDNATIADVAVMAAPNVILGYTGASAIVPNNDTTLADGYVEFNASTKYITLNKKLADAVGNKSFTLYVVTDKDSTNTGTALTPINIVIPAVQ